jgi:hypothetical protein
MRSVVPAKAGTQGISKPRSESKPLPVAYRMGAPPRDPFHLDNIRSCP